MSPIGRDECAKLSIVCLLTRVEGLFRANAAIMGTGGMCKALRNLQ